MSTPRDDMPPDRNLALELVRVTEAAALQAARYVGMGDKEAADQAAVDGMHAVLHTIHMDGIVVIGEGEKDEAPMLANGEVVGDGTPPHVDIAVDPLDGTRLTAQGRPNAVSVIALSERGTMFDPGPVFYMEKMAGRDEIVDLLDLDRPLGQDRRARGGTPRRRGARRDGRRARPPAPRGGHQRDPRGGRARAADHRRRRRRRAAGRRPGAARGPAVGHRRHARGRDHRRRAEVLRRRHDRPPVAERRRGAQAGRGRRVRRHEGDDPRRPGQGRELLLLRHRRDRRRRAARRPLRGRPRRDDGVAGHALPLRHRAADRLAPRPRRSCAS